MREVIIYTDGSSIGNPGPGGWAAILIEKEIKKEFTGGYRLTTNNRMELMAVIGGIKNSHVSKNDKVTVYTDSRLIVDAVNQNWLINWKLNNWRKSNKEPVLNKDLWLKLDELINALNIDFIWLKGHSGIPENENCDLLSKRSATSDFLETDQYYEEMNPPNLFVNSEKTRNNRTILKEDNFITNDAFYIIRLIKNNNNENYIEIDKKNNSGENKLQIKQSELNDFINKMTEFSF